MMGILFHGPVLLAVTFLLVCADIDGILAPLRAMRWRRPR